jgi:hypothetical protein
MVPYAFSQIRNYEVGVVFPLRDESAVETVTCWERPPKRYVPGKDEPWVRRGCSCRFERVRAHSVSCC